MSVWCLSTPTGCWCVGVLQMYDASKREVFASRFTSADLMSHNKSLSLLVVVLYDGHSIIYDHQTGWPPVVLLVGGSNLLTGGLYRLRGRGTP